MIDIIVIGSFTLEVKKLRCKVVRSLAQGSKTKNQQHEADTWGGSLAPGLQS